MILSQYWNRYSFKGEDPVLENVCLPLFWALMGADFPSKSSPFRYFGRHFLLSPFKKWELNLSDVFVLIRCYSQSSGVHVFTGFMDEGNHLNLVLLNKSV